MVGPSNAEIDFLANSYISCGLFTVEYFILDSEEFSFEEPLYRDKICFVSCRERERESGQYFVEIVEKENDNL